MALKNLGPVSPEIVRLFQQKKLMMVVRAGNEVWIDDADEATAMDLMRQNTKTVAAPNEQIYRFYGCLIKMPKEIALDQRYYAQMTNPSGRRGRIHIHEFAKPANGLDVSDKMKRLPSVTIRKEAIEFKGVGSVPVFSPAYTGVVMCDDTGIPLFEVSAFNIWVLFDTKASQESTRKIYEQMLMYAIVLSDHANPQSQEVWNKIWSQQAPEREKWEIKQFEEVVIGGVRKEIQTLEAMISQRNNSITQLQQKVFNEAKALASEQMKLEGYKAVLGSGLEAKAREEWEKLKILERNGAVRNIRVTQERISFTTRDIMWTPPRRGQIYKNTEDASKTVVADEPVKLGSYEVTIYIGTAFHIEIVNLTKTLSYKAETWHHPHIKEGNVCKGNMTETLPVFAAQRNFEAIIMCMLKWLENVDTNDTWGKDIYYWIVDDKKRRDEEAARKAEAEKEAAKASPKQEGGAQEPASAPAPAPVPVGSTPVTA